MKLPPGHHSWNAALLVAMGLFVSGMARAEPVPLPGTRLLQAGATRAWVMDPAAPDRYNTGVRFTPVAAVLQVEHAGRTYLHAPREHDPREDHAGLAAEFDLCIPGGPAEHLPSGFAEAANGEGFVKIGVGVLAKTGGSYHLFQRPKVLALAETETRWLPDRAVFTQTCEAAAGRGYAYELKAEVQLREGELTVDWDLRNTGSRPLTTRHYAHNFLAFQGCATVEGYDLEFPYPIQPRGLEAGQRAEGRAIRFIGPIPKWINASVPYPAGYEGVNSLIARHAGAGMRLTISTSLPGLRTDIHARAAYIAPEQFIEISLAPGESRQWQGHYRFELL
jgi:hypothetical protein